MKNKESINWNLAGRILSGEASLSEVEEFNLWLANANNKKEWDEINKKMESIDYALVSENIDLHTAWKKVKYKTTEKPIRLNVTRYSYIAVAASILIAIFLFFNQQFSKSPKLDIQLAQTSNSIQSVKLNDGSIIDINRNSLIQYPKEFSGNKRSISLKGEAFFNIAPDKDRPFIIEAGKLQVKVLGTSFNIKAYSNKSEVIVKSGIVEVSSLLNNNNKTILYAGDRFLFDANNNTFEKKENKDVNYLAWKTKEIAFKNENLSHAINLIEEVYNVTIEIPEGYNMDSAMITATFDKNTIDFIIEVINKTHSIELKYSYN